ncbi:hypothetical protein GUITHDRAFT_104710 [Guillardia theta CCMP2712]|uniref:Uncharacterized protein n=2 Tax=Guillardia theta TaxID=55529 RepID=L1JN94_GUITC|nr:hypothetical protein GUITHDRAFT_104710 [Guillardia theta CCMP2712]EKX49744.1 hypothetical protein GUITHDRAFT_104710 [Guillardia theta CCMP2712]|eukprot:XP_005836724.1 hypothetical protein GUITHDRAFT_104710 [Guillardia theta CCMP2712]
MTSEESGNGVGGDLEKKSKVDEWKAYFLEHGLTPTDLAKALVVHETVGISWLAGSWGLCYAVQPIRRLGSRYFQQNIDKFFDKAFTKLQPVFRWSARFALVRSMDKQRLIMSLAESSILRNAARPVTVPLKLWVAVQVVLMTKKR